MTIQSYRVIVGKQFGAAVAMLEDCIQSCPPEHWQGLIGKYAFWHVAYHTLYCTDMYTATEAEWKPGKFQPGGACDVEDEYPSRGMTQAEVLEYTAHVRRLVSESLAEETEESLAGPSGFLWLEMTRAEVPIYNMRHVQHHTGQLAAFLRRQHVPTRYVKRGETVG